MFTCAIDDCCEGLTFDFKFMKRSGICFHNQKYLKYILKSFVSQVLWPKVKFVILYFIFLLHACFRWAKVTTY